MVCPLSSLKEGNFVYPLEDYENKKEVYEEKGIASGKKVLAVIEGDNIVAIQGVPLKKSETKSRR